MTQSTIFLRRLRPLVAASIGPHGAMPADGSAYRGRYAPDDGALAYFHRRANVR